MSELAHSLEARFVIKDFVDQKINLAAADDLPFQLPHGVAGVVDDQTEAPGSRLFRPLSLRSASQPPTEPGRLIIGDDTVEALMLDMSTQVSGGWSSPLLVAFTELEGDREALRALVAQRVEDMLVTIGESQRAGESPVFPVALADGFTSPMLFEFLRRFPLSTKGLTVFMELVHRDLKKAYNAGYKVHGEWGELAWDRLLDSMSVSMSALVD